MRLATWNVNSIKARLPFVLGWLKARRPDVVCIQELKVADDDFPYDTFDAAGYRCAVHGQPQWNGVAVLSRRPAEVVQRGLPGAEDQGARLVTAVVDGLSVTSVYVPNGKTVEHPDYEAKLVWLDRLGDYVEKVVDPAAPHVIGGDFNIAPGPLDSWDPQRFAGTIFHTDAELERYERLLGAGLDDLYRHTHPDGAMFSWWDYRAGAFHKNQGLRIDFLLATAPVRDRVDTIGVDRDYRKKHDGETPSDHAPVIADLGDQETT